MSTPRDIRHHYYYNPAEDPQTVDVQVMCAQAGKALVDKYRSEESVVHYHSAKVFCNLDLYEHKYFLREK